MIQNIHQVKLVEKIILIKRMLNFQFNQNIQQFIMLTIEYFDLIKLYNFDDFLQGLSLR